MYYRRKAIPQTCSNQLNSTIMFYLFDTAASYDEANLDSHLEYLATYSGTPDCLYSSESLILLCDKAANTVGAAVITDEDFTEIYRTNELTKL